MLSRRVLLGAASTVRQAFPVLRTAAPVRALHVHEYLGMEVMNKYGIHTPKGAAADTLKEVEHIYDSVIGSNNDCVIKAQVLTGGRGLGHFKSGLKGGVHLCTDKKMVMDYAKGMLGQTLVTKQTGERGILCQKVLLVERVYMRREMYVSILLDRKHGGAVMVASARGGTSIEDIAEEHPDQIAKLPISVEGGLSEEAAAGMAVRMGLPRGTKQHAQGVETLRNLYRMFRATDATMIEVNPLAETADHRVLVCDAKINFDDNAAFRQKEIHALRDLTQEDPREVEASKHDLNYIGLSGSIGCMVNGAGLAMATMDIIKLKGGSPANFLDVGGGASATQVQKAFELLNADPNVKTILVNIFGGIMRCDVIAQGIIAAAKEIGMKKPIVIRLKGTNVNEAKALIANCGFKMIVTDDLDDAAQKAVSIAEIVTRAEEAHLEVQFTRTA